jgi:DNA polymerase sigma
MPVPCPLQLPRILAHVPSLLTTVVPCRSFLLPSAPCSNLRCDLGINNLLAVRNSKLLRDYCALDPRVRQMVYLIKHWAKRRNINDPFRGTLSSYAYVLMVSFCLLLCFGLLSFMLS